MASKDEVENDTEPDTIDSDDMPDVNVGNAPAPQEDSVEERRVIGVKEPECPTASDIAEHNIAHAHFRSWCPICVAAKGVSDPHYRQPERTERTLSTVCADYCFMCRDPSMEEQAEKEEDEDDAVESTVKTPKITILTVLDSMSGCMRLHYVPHKGTRLCPWIGTEVAKDIELWGHSLCVFKSDQERAMIAVFNETVKARAPLKTIPENFPKEDSQANGLVERGNRTGKDQVRVLLFALEAHLGVKIHLNHPIIAWICTHAGYIASHVQIK